MGIAFVNAVLFGAYGRLRSLLHPDPGPAGTWYTVYFVCVRVRAIVFFFLCFVIAHFGRELAVCGAGAGIANSVIASPVEMLKARLQVQYSAGSDRQFRYMHFK
jgi:solute carrier family 25 carnitine/acylcarnitine transporter 20/29